MELYKIYSLNTQEDRKKGESDSRTNRTNKKQIPRRWT